MNLLKPDGRACNWDRRRISVEVFRVARERLGGIGEHVDGKATQSQMVVRHMLQHIRLAALAMCYPNAACWRMPGRKFLVE